MPRRIPYPLLALLALASVSGAQDGPGHDGHREGEHHDQQSQHDQHGQHGQHGLRHDFSDAERWTKVFDEPSRDAWQMPDAVVEVMAIEPGMTVVDLGAGTGYFLRYLSAAVGDGGRVLALDPEANLVEFMTERATREGWSNVAARQIPFDDPSLEDASVDRILVVDTWHHIDARSEYAAKLRRALRPGGRVIVVDFTLDSPSGPPKEHRLEPQVVVDELAGGGFEAGVVDAPLPRQYVVVGR